jgi:DNA-binding beta-propeller fold protein YncE
MPARRRHAVFPTGADGSDGAVAFSPDGRLLATANGDDGASLTDNVSLLRVNGSSLTPVAGSPFPTGAGTLPRDVTFSPIGRLLAIANTETGTTSVFALATR